MQKVFFIRKILGVRFEVWNASMPPRMPPSLQTSAKRRVAKTNDPGAAALQVEPAPPQSRGLAAGAGQELTKVLPQGKPSPGVNSSKSTDAIGHIACVPAGGDAVGGAPVEPQAVHSWGLRADLAGKRALGSRRGDLDIGIKRVTKRVTAMEDGQEGGQQEDDSGIGHYAHDQSSTGNVYKSGPPKVE